MLRELLYRIILCCRGQTRLEENLAHFATGELALPAEEMAVATHCQKVGCTGEVHQLKDRAAILKMRAKVKKNSAMSETLPLECAACKTKFTVSSQLNRRCFNTAAPSEAEIHQLIWTGIGKRPEDDDRLNLDKWMLKLFVLQRYFNNHDWKHLVPSLLTLITLITSITLLRCLASNLSANPAGIKHLSLLATPLK
jgi:hypothetical protein